MIWLASFLIAGWVLAADQASKALIVSRSLSHAPAPRLRGVSFRCVLNRKGTLGSFVGTPALVGLWAVAVEIIALALQHGMLGRGLFASLGVGAAIGGAAGNLLDWIRRGAVVDFISIGPWRVFNLADAAIVSGVGLTLLAAR